ncbi:MAG: zinc-binding alcohol dehydrogenase family protein [Chloroflexi bacterium]|nr:zinc-binding alcohol dehydrogenase family protein [Chloroflexota bacterium]
MKAIALTEYGGPEVLHFVDVPMPAPRPRDLVVRVKAFAVNPTDAKRRRAGTAPLQAPLVLGFDGAGIVEQTGPQASLFHAGDEVYFAGDATRAGCYAEFVAIDERIVGRKPKTLGFAAAAGVPLTALTAWESFFEGMRLEPTAIAAKRTVLIVGGAGGVGSIAIQIAKRVAGLRVVATAGRAESNEFCKRMGADQVIDHTQGLAPQLTALGIEGVDYILNCADLTYVPQLSSVLNPIGVICCILGGDSAKSLDVSGLFAKRGTLAFELMFTRPRVGIEPERQGEILNRVSALLDDHTLVSTVTQTLDWREIQQAHRAIDGEHTLGKIALEVSV